MSRLRSLLGALPKLSAPHKGLLLEKHVPPKVGKESNAAALQEVCRVPSTYTLYRLAFERWKKWCECRKLVCLEGKLKGRLALGLGQESVHEIGCRLHHTYGTPVIPASGIRGALRAHAHGQSYCDFLFGSQESAGYVTVYPAWWIPEGNASGLAPDIITVHHQDYYAGKAPPTDFDSPIPVSFLTITGKFFFACEAPNDSWAEFLKPFVKEALGNQGLGAKRSSGYGRFQFP